MGARGGRKVAGSIPESHWNFSLT